VFSLLVNFFFTLAKVGGSVLGLYIEGVTNLGMNHIERCGYAFCLWQKFF